MLIIVYKNYFFNNNYLYLFNILLINIILAINYYYVKIEQLLLKFNIKIKFIIINF